LKQSCELGFVLIALDANAPQRHAIGWRALKAIVYPFAICFRRLREETS
jgi:hypothetical protein